MDRSQINSSQVVLSNFGAKQSSNLGRHGVVTNLVAEAMNLRSQTRLSDPSYRELPEIETPLRISNDNSLDACERNQALLAGQNLMTSTPKEEYGRQRVRVSCKNQRAAQALESLYVQKRSISTSQHARPGGGGAQNNERLKTSLRQR